MSSQHDVVIVGGGAIGCSIAFHLAKRGMRPLVLERGRLGGEATTASSGIVYGHHGSDGLARLSRDSYAMIPSEVEELKELGGIDAELIKCGRLDVALTDAEASLFRSEVGPHAEQGIAADWLDSEQARELEPALSESIRGGLHVPDVSAVNNQRLSDAYAAGATRLGARVRLGVDIAGLTRGGARVTGVRLHEGDIQAGHVVIAAGAWSRVLGESIGVSIPVRPVRGQNLNLMPAAGSVRTNLTNGECVIVPRADGSLIVGVTVEEAGFDSRVTAEGVREILDRAVDLVPALGEASLTWTIAGLRPASADDLPIIGAVSGLDGLSIATGHYRSGIVLSPITGSLIAGQIAGESSEYLSIFGPDRFQSS